MDSQRFLDLPQMSLRSGAGAVHVGANQHPVASTQLGVEHVQVFGNGRHIFSRDPHQLGDPAKYPVVDRPKLLQSQLQQGGCERPSHEECILF